ncbi:MAG: hypothetical protein ACTH1D_07320, partial [Mycobacteriaceae bacterium]
MDVTYLDHISLSGPFTEFRCGWPATVAGPAHPLTFNQRNHLDAHSATGRSTWIGGAVRLPSGIPDTGDSAADLVASLIDGADALRTVPVGDGQKVHAPGEVAVRPGPVRDRPPSSDELGRMIDERCRPGRVPGLFFARSGNTLLFAVDHFHADMLSVDLLQRRVHGDVPGPVGFLDTLEGPRAAPGEGDDRAMAVWRRFLALTGHRIPDFPVDLGVPAGGAVEPVHDVRRLVDAGRIPARLDRSTFAVLLTALAGAVEPMSGTGELHIVMPVHTRGGRADPRHRTVGWMVGNAPVVARAGDAATAAEWLGAAVTVAGLPLETMVTRLSPVLPPGAVPMVSYMDFR